jgi:hypothetical protein
MFRVTVMSTMRTIAIDAAEMKFRHTLGLAGTFCEVTTNSNQLGKTLHAWRGATNGHRGNRFTMQVCVAPGTADGDRYPHFRGLHHVIVASFGASNVFVFDLLRRNVAASVSEDIARDESFWNDVLLPIAMGVLGAAVGVVPVHCACLAAGDEGLLVAGSAGAGKSTLSAALAQSGFDFISDDWTYLAWKPEGLMAHGMATPVKLLPDAIRHFPMLAAHAVRPALDGELAYRMSAANFGAEIRLSCSPRWFLFLERTVSNGCLLAPISSEEARVYLEAGVERLPVQLQAIAEKRAEIIGRISSLSCWRLRYGGPPQVAAAGIREFVARQKQEVQA